MFWFLIINAQLHLTQRTEAVWLMSRANSASFFPKFFILVFDSCHLATKFKLVSSSFIGGFRLVAEDTEEWRRQILNLLSSILRFESIKSFSQRTIPAKFHANSPIFV